MKEKSFSDLDKQERKELEDSFNYDWKLDCPPTWKERCGIEDEEMIELIRKIFILIDQAWNDYAAHVISLLINDFINEKRRV
jgi:hypothetical protein